MVLTGAGSKRVWPLFFEECFEISNYQDSKQKNKRGVKNILGTNRGIAVEESFHDGNFVLKIDGQLNRENVKKFYSILEPYFYRHKPIVLDLSTLSLSDNFGVTALIERYQWSRVIKNEFRIKGLSKSLKNKFDLVGFSDFIELDNNFFKEGKNEIPKRD